MVAEASARREMCRGCCGERKQSVHEKQMKDGDANVKLEVGDDAGWRR